MINISLICLGKLKEKYLREAFSEYEKRLSGLCKLTLFELSPERFSENPSRKEIDLALFEEGKRIAEKIPKGAFVISLCIEGKELSSEALSERIEEISLSGKSNICFIIGSSFGLSQEIKERSDLRLSMSKMTFPHQIARIMLTEQIYRALQISAGSKYHK